MEDIAILRALPNMTVFCPSGPKETRDGLLAALLAATVMPGEIVVDMGRSQDQDSKTLVRMSHAVKLL